MISQLLPRAQIMGAALALRVRCKRPSTIRSLGPGDSEPVQVLQHCADKFWATALRIEILIAKNQNATMLGGSLRSRPEGASVANVEKSRR